jgi:hypothetical protein
MKLWHVSDNSQIERFEPLMPSPGAATALVPVVWAVAKSHLFPRPGARAPGRGADLRIVPRFREFAADVAASTLSFSVIRPRNAAL